MEGVEQFVKDNKPQLEEIKEEPKKDDDKSKSEKNKLAEPKPKIWEKLGGYLKAE